MRYYEGDVDDRRQPGGGMGRADRRGELAEMGFGR